MADFATLKENVSLELGLNETASGDEDNLVGRRLNQAVREVLLRTHLYVVTDTVALVADDNEYDLATELDPDPLAVLNIVNSDDRPLDRVSVEEILELRRSTVAASTLPWRYTVDGATLLMLYPTPSSAGTLTVRYVPKPTEMSSGTHDPATTTYGYIPVEFHDLLEWYTLWRMASYDDDASSGVGETYRRLFEEGCARARANIRRRGGRKLAPARVGRRTRVPSDPSTDVYY